MNKRLILGENKRQIDKNNKIKRSNAIITTGINIINIDKMPKLKDAKIALAIF